MASIDIPPRSDGKRLESANRKPRSFFVLILGPPKSPFFACFGTSEQRRLSLYKQ